MTTDTAGRPTGCVRGAFVEPGVDDCFKLRRTAETSGHGIERVSTQDHVNGRRWTSHPYSLLRPSSSEMASIDQSLGLRSSAPPASARQPTIWGRCLTGEVSNASRAGDKAHANPLI